MSSVFFAPQVYDELEDITGYSRNTIQDAKYVAKNTSSVRTEDLSFTHHKLVAPLQPEEQKHFYPIWGIPYRYITDS